MSIYVADIEGDSLTPTKIHCLSVMNVTTGKIFSTTDYEQMRRFWKKAKVVIGHNFKRFDVPVCERLLGIKIKSKVIDSLALSWYLYPSRLKHGLEEWGEHYGVPKPIINDWEGLPVEEYIHRCEEDVKINHLLWVDQFKYLIEIYGTQDKVWKFLDYISFKMDCAVLQEASGWKVDKKYLDDAIEELTKLKEGKISELAESMPPVPKYKIRSKPKRFINSNGDYSKLGLDWLKFLDDHGFPPHHEEDVKFVSGYEPGNPDSPQQVKDWLYANGWVPRTFEYKKDKQTGEVKAIPQINLDHGKGICDSIKELYVKQPALELLDGLSVITHRLGVLKGIRSGMDENGYTKAQIKGFTNTLRVKHTTVVNLPKVDKPYGKFIRGSLVAEDGTILCGSDMSSLEDRIKQHFIYFYDPDYVNSMNEKGFDPHLVIAVIAGMCSQEDADNYKYVALLNDDQKNQIKKEAMERKQNETILDWAKRIKPIRDIAKNGNYACQYGAGVARLVLTCNIDNVAAKKLFDAYWKLNWAIKKIAEDQTVKTINDQMWLFNPISGFWYSLRFTKDIFSTLVQGTASYLFDMWLKFILEKRPQLTATFHDEFVLQIKEGFESQCTELVKYAIDRLNEEVKLNKILEVNTQFGKRYSDIH